MDKYKELKITSEHLTNATFEVVKLDIHLSLGDATFNMISDKTHQGSNHFISELIYGEIMDYHEFC